jgi:hypothetical protein
MVAKEPYVAFAILMALSSSGDRAFGQSIAAPTTTTVTFATNTSDNQITRLTTKLIVPAKPQNTGTLYLWPGLQPNGANYEPIGNGVLQAVLTWGPSCAPSPPSQPGQPAPSQPTPYSTWWISGQYVNTDGNYKGYMDCLGGPIMSVDVGDVLLISIQIFDSVWTETILDLKNYKSENFHIYLENQYQSDAYFQIESYGTPFLSDLVFNETEIVFRNPDEKNCSILQQGSGAVVTSPILVGDGQECYIDKITLKWSPKLVAMPVSCSEEKSARSIEKQDQIQAVFKNNHGSPVKLYQIDNAGNRKYYATISDGDSVSQPTFRTNPWVITDTAGTCLGLFRPSSSHAQFVVH